MGKVNQTEALIKLYHCVNGPVQAGPKYVKYRREQVNAMLDVLKQILISRGCELRAE